MSGDVALISALERLAGALERLATEVEQVHEVLQTLADQQQQTPKPSVSRGTQESKTQVVPADTKPKGVIVSQT